MSGLDQQFQDYFQALDRAGGEDRCFLCRRAPSDVKFFFGFGEDGVPLDAERHGLEDISLDSSDIMSYLGTRPVCAVCQLNLDANCALGDQGSYLELLRQMEDERDGIWPPATPPASGEPTQEAPNPEELADPGTEEGNGA
jgi:hypothetical protein